MKSSFHHKIHSKKKYVLRQAGSNFDYGGPLTELGLLGAIAIRYPTQTLEWDSDMMQFTNFSEANAWIDQPYRSGWSL